MAIAQLAPPGWPLVVVEFTLAHRPQKLPTCKPKELRKICRRQNFRAWLATKAVFVVKPPKNSITTSDLSGRCMLDSPPPRAKRGQYWSASVQRAASPSDSEAGSMARNGSRKDYFADVRRAKSALQKGSHGEKNSCTNDEAAARKLSFSAAAPRACAFTYAREFKAA